jgi:hypothetical protein
MRAARLGFLLVVLMESIAGDRYLTHQRPGEAQLVAVGIGDVEGSLDLDCAVVFEFGGASAAGFVAFVKAGPVEATKRRAPKFSPVCTARSNECG